MEGVAREVECKLELAPGASVAQLPGWRADPQGVVQLRTVYWDTADQRLRRAGHALRHRTVNGATAHWTLKTAREQHGNLAVRDEHDEPGPLRRQPPQLVHALCAVTGDVPLRRVATIDVCRSVTLLRRGAAIIEMAEDRVTSRVGRRLGPAFDELELELVEGHADDLAAAHDALVARGATPSPWTSKLARVLDELPVLPSTGTPQHVGQLASIAIDHAVTRLLRHDPALRLAPDDEAVHQARVATRRLRSDLRSLRPFLDVSRVTELDDELAWLAELLGTVRDLDVLAIGIRRRQSSIDGDEHAWNELFDIIGGERGSHLLAVQEALESPRYLTLVGDLRALEIDPPLAAHIDAATSARTAAEQVTERAWRRLQRSVHRLPRHPADADLHDVRKRVKLARYAYELVADIARRRRTRRLAAIEALQALLGSLQDTVVAREWLDAHADELSPRAAYLAGQLHAANEHEAVRLRAAFPSAWKAARRA